MAVGPDAPPFSSALCIPDVPGHGNQRVECRRSDLPAIAVHQPKLGVGLHNIGRRRAAIGIEDPANRRVQRAAIVPEIKPLPVLEGNEMAVGTALDGLIELGIQQEVAVGIEQAPAVIPLDMPAERRSSVAGRRDRPMKPIGINSKHPGASAVDRSRAPALPYRRAWETGREGPCFVEDGVNDESAAAVDEADPAAHPDAGETVAERIHRIELRRGQPASIGALQPP
jgi:hypothetical protein